MDVPEINSFKYNCLIDDLINVLSEDRRVLFAYLHGSLSELKMGRDIDIALCIRASAESYSVSADIKIALHKKTGLPPETFDINIVNDLTKKGDIFALLYLKNVLEENRLLVDKMPSARADFLEQYGSKFRECEGLMQEVVG